MIVRRSLFFPIVRIFALLIIGAIVAFVVALSQVNLDTLRGSIVGVLQDATGLPVQVDGSVSWRLSLRPSIELNQVRVASADWAKDRFAYSAEKIDVRLNLISLFRNRPTIQNIRVYDAKINIEKNQDGKYSVPNFAKNKEQENVKKTQDLYPFKDFGFGGVEVKNLTANIFGKKYSLAGLNVRLVKRKDKHEYSGWVKLDKNISSFILSFSQYNPDRKIYPVQVAVSTKGEALIANVALEGTSKLPIDFIVKGNMPDVSTVGKFFGIDLFALPNLKVDVAGGFDGNKIKIRKAWLFGNDTNLVVSGDYDLKAKQTIINANVSSDYVNLARLFPDVYNKKRQKPNRKLNVFKDIPLFGEFMYDKTINLRVELGQLVMYRDFNIKNLDLKFNLQNNRIRVDSDLNIAQGDVVFAIDADVLPDGTLVTENAFVGQGVHVGEILHEINKNDFISDLPVNIDLFVKARGKNLSEIMQTITGPVKIYSVDKGYAHSALVSYMYGTDFLTSLRHSIEDLFSSEKKNDQIKISCFALNAKLRDGVFETQNGFAIETNAINIRLGGALNLGDEDMKLFLTTVPVRGLKLSLTGNVVNSVSLTGSLAEPDIKISGAAVAGKVASATGIGLLLAPITGGLSLVAGAGIGLVAGDLLENWLADSHPCETAMDRGAPEYRDDPEWMKKSIEELIDTKIVKQ